MQTPLPIDDGLLPAAENLGERQGKPVGEVISALTPGALGPAMRNGVPLLPARRVAGPVTLEWVNRLRDEAP